MCEEEVVAKKTIMKTGVMTRTVVDEECGVIGDERIVEALQYGRRV